ncbi:MAG: hypothetical protein V4677_00835 [Bacteroidota bacterium]
MVNQAINSDTLLQYGAEKIMLNHRFNQPHSSTKLTNYINYGFKLSSLDVYAEHQAFFKSSSNIHYEQDRSLFYREFILINPKGAIADDFMFAFNIQEYTYIGVMKIDFSESTKIMVSMAISQYIDMLVNERQILMPSVILKKIQEFIYDVIQYDSLDHFSKHDLMISLACIDKSNKQIVYSGSHKGVFLTLNDCLYDISAEQKQQEKNKGLQHHYFRDYVLSLSASDTSYSEDLEDYPMHLYFSNSKSYKAIN